jgi:threonine dehydrogenase-like Zn-dependent dehydrogenase
MALTVSAAVPGLPTVRVCWPEAPTLTAPTDSEVVDSAMAAPIPVALRLTDLVGVVGSLLGTVRVAVFGPGKVGVNVIVTLTLERTPTVVFVGDTANCGSEHAMLVSESG